MQLLPLPSPSSRSVEVWLTAGVRGQFQSKKAMRKFTFWLLEAKSYLEYITIFFWEMVNVLEFAFLSFNVFRRRYREFFPFYKRRFENSWRWRVGIVYTLLNVGTKVSMSVCPFLSSSGSRDNYFFYNLFQGLAMKQLS